MLSVVFHWFLLSVSTAEFRIGEEIQCRIAIRLTKICLIFDCQCSFANANVLLVLGELMGGDGGEDGGASQSAIPLIAGAIVLAQVTMVRR